MAKYRVNEVGAVIFEKPEEDSKLELIEKRIEKLEEAIKNLQKSIDKGKKNG